MSDKKAPEICNNCGSKDVMFCVWGRTEYYTCKSCKKEVTSDSALISYDDYWNLPTSVWYDNGGD